MKIEIPAASGLEAAVKREIERMGLGEAPAIRGRIVLEGDWNTVARLNVRLRAGERVLAVLGEFPASTFDELFEGVFCIPWEELLSAKCKILLDGKSMESKLAAVKAAGGVVKKAILKRLGEKLRVRTFDESGERAIVGVSLYRDVATVTLDTSGDGLHKRGYRVKTYDAPLRETMAAAVIEDSFYRRDRCFADPFCGSGTIPIEAALYARGIAPGHARTFDFTRFKGVPKDALRRANEEAREEVWRGEIAPIFASDLSPRAVELAKEHARRAGVEKDIRFSVADMGAFSSVTPYGILVSNPPYGERMTGDLPALYRALRAMIMRLPDWSAYVITAFEDAERILGRPDRRKLLYNAHLKCSLLSYFGKKPVSS